MIDPNEPVFPNNIVLILIERMKTIDADLSVFRRPLRPSDPNQSIGVVAQLWYPEDDSYELLGGGFNQPTLQRYQIAIQAFIRHGDEEEGLAAHSVLSNSVRTVLYKDDALRLAFAGLKVSYTNGSSELLKKWGIGTQRYFTNELDAEWLYLSTLEFWIETENS